MGRKCPGGVLSLSRLEPREGPAVAVGSVKDEDEFEPGSFEASTCLTSTRLTSSSRAFAFSTCCGISRSPSLVFPAFLSDLVDAFDLTLALGSSSSDSEESDSSDDDEEPASEGAFLEEDGDERNNELLRRGEVADNRFLLSVPFSGLFCAVVCFLLCAVICLALPLPLSCVEIEAETLWSAPGPVESCCGKVPDRPLLSVDVVADFWAIGKEIRGTLVRL